MSPSCAPWRVHLLSVFAAVALAPAWPVHAQEPTLEGEAVEIDMPAGSVRAPAAASTVIDAVRFGGEVRTVSELLATAPGVSIHATGGPGQTATVSLRGATADQSLILLDGIPLQGPGGGAVDLSVLPATLLERMVVSRGVLGARFGAGALGGAIELVPRAARERLAGGAQLSAGSFGTAQAAFDVATPLGDGGSAVVAVQLDRTAGDFQYDRQLTPELPSSPYYAFTRENADARRGATLLRVARTLSPGLELDLLGQASMGERGVPGSSSELTSTSRARDVGGLFGARLRGLAGDAVWSLRAWGRGDRVELSHLQPFGACDTCPSVTQHGGAGRAEAELAAPVSSRHLVKALLSAGEESLRGSATGSHARPTFAAAVSDDVRLAPGLSLHPAVRFDRDGGAQGLSPGLSAVWRPSALELHAGWGLSFRAPTFAELYLDQGGLVPNPELQPERAASIDAGATYRTGALTLSTGVFWSKYRELILYELYPPARIKAFNTGAARVAGAELQAVVALPHGFSAEAAYSFLDAVNDREGPQQGHHLSYRPPHRLFLRAARRGDRVEGYAETSFTARMPRNQSDTAFVGPQVLVNAGVGARVAGPLWLDVEAKNLLDQRTFEDLFQYPLPGLAISVIARARL